MNNLDIETYKGTWKEESNNLIKNDQLTENDIKEYLTKRSKSISSLYQKGIIIDIIFKTTIGISFIGLVFLFSTNISIMLISLSSIILMGVLILFQIKINKKFSAINEMKNDIKTDLNQKIKYYYKYYIKSIYISAISSPYFFLCSAFYYFYFKYGTIRQFEIDDYIVFSVGIILAFFISFISNKYQFNFYIKELKENLTHLDKESFTNTILKEQVQKRRRNLIIAFISIVLGVLIFSYLLFAN